MLPGIHAGSPARTACLGAALGFFACATFDLTSLALIRGWSAALAVVGMLWGTKRTESVSGIAAWIARRLM
jgi:uncharacterized membrane protein